MICKFQHLALFIPLLTSGFSVAAASNEGQLPPAAQIISRMYFGERKPVNSCGEGGRLLNEMEAWAVRTLFCEETLSDKWSSWKLAKNNGGFLTLQGKGYGCGISESADPWSRSLCIAENHAPKDVALLFPNNDYRGIGAMRGKPDLHHPGDKVADANVTSFVLGDGIRLIGYSRPNLQGDMQVFYKSTPETPFPIRSYRLDQYLNNAIAINYQAPKDAPESCLLLESGKQRVSLCTNVDNDPDKPAIFTTEASTPSTTHQISISIFFYKNTTSTPPRVAIGHLHLSRSNNSQPQIDYSRSSLPESLAVSLDGSSLNFTRQP